MLAIFTSIIGPVFITAAIVLSILVLYWFVRRELKASKNPDYSPIMGTVRTVIVASFLIVAITLGWRITQDHFNRPDDYENPKQKEYIRKVMATTAPTEQEIRANTKKIDKNLKAKHDESLSDFDKKMAAEAKKIQERNK